MTSTDRFRIAIPKGRLLDETLATFAAASCDVPSAEDLRSRALVFHRGGIEWILVKDSDVPVYVEHGAADVGVAGLDQIVEHESTAHSLVELTFGTCRMALVATPTAPPLDDRANVATKYPRVTRQYLDRIGVHADVVVLGGSVELAAVLHLTTHVVDLVQSGQTIRANGLVEQDLVMNVSPWLIAGRDAYRTQRKRIRDLVSRIEESTHATVSS
jgi:ATP phosphoribosyltransferase